MQQRLEPLGASDDKHEEPPWPRKECQQCTCLEEEKEMLQTSLFALTTHFAQVQFRLRQVCDAPAEEQEDLLKSLEKFAFMDVTLDTISDDEVMQMVKKWRNQQKLLLSTLKSQVRELKNFECEDIGLNLLLRMKEDVEKQLRTQIADLERFIEHMRSDKCICKQSEKSLKNYVIDVLQKGVSFMRMFFVIQLTKDCFSIKADDTHWGDLRANLELAIINLQKLLRCNSDPKTITLAVRRSLAPSLRDLIHHGLKTHAHCWDIILFYYNLRKGDEFNSSALQKLSRSFNLEIAGVSPDKSRKNLLFAIEHIVSLHSRYKRGNETLFKAFICAALNARRLVSWLHLIFHCGEILKHFYYPWSYVSTTRFQDGLRSLGVLMKHKFDLPVDLEVKKFEIEDTVFV